MRAPHVRKPLVAAIAMTLFTLSSPVFANEGDPIDVSARDYRNPVEAIVRYSDLNLRHDEGVARLNTRVRMAAQRVCQNMGRKPLAEMAAADACYKGAMTRGARDIELAVAAERGDTQVASNSRRSIAIASTGK